MMKRTSLLSFLIFLLNFNNSYSWDSTAAKFYPLAVGNSWSYNHKIYQPPLGCTAPTPQYNFIFSIVSDTTIAGHRYFRFSNGSLERIDSNSMNVYKRIGNGECLLDSLFATRRNNFYNTCRSQFSQVQVCDTSQVNFAGQNRRSKVMCGIGGSYRLMYGIGLFAIGYCELQQGFVDSLNGCIINGMQYGQMLGVEIISNEIPSGFKLYQNYPNPFNQATVINFQLSIKSEATIKVYDAAGREAAVIFKGVLDYGIYRIDWNASDYPSGIYFYSMFADGRIVATKRLVLVK